MSFSTYARKVRDPGLPYARRVSALRSCVQLYGPIGFCATLSFLEEWCGPYQRDEASLLRALDALSVSRAGWHAELREYVTARKQAKRRGQRSPRPADDNPNGFPPRWYGAPQQAALHALRFWRFHRASAAKPQDQVTDDLDMCVTAALASDGQLTLDQQQVLAACVNVLQQRVRSRQDDVAAAVQAWGLLKVARHIETAGRTA